MTKDRPKVLGSGGIISSSTTPPKSASVISPERLLADEQEVARSFIHETGARGVLIGAIRGKSPLDLRPLILDRSSVSLLRRFVFQGAASHAKGESLVKAFEAVTVRESFSVLTDFGITEKYVWSRRTFVSSTFEDAPPTSFLQHSSRGEGARTIAVLADTERAVVDALLGTLETIHSRGVVHGHLAPSNVALQPSGLALLDFFWGAQGCSVRPGSLAPEVALGQPPTSASDVYGLAGVLEALLPGSWLDARRPFFDALRATHPGARPSISEVRRTLDELGNSAGAAVHSHAGLSPRASVQSTSPSHERLTGKHPSASSRQPGDSRIISVGSPTHVKSSVRGVNQEGKGTVEGQRASDKKGVTRPQAPWTATYRRPLWGAAAILLGGIGYYLAFGPQTVSPEAVERYEVLWASGDEAKRAEVLTDAVDRRNVNAVAFLVQEAEKERSHRTLRSGLVSFVFDKRWDTVVSVEDRGQALLLAYGAALTSQDIPTLSSERLHPVVYLGLATATPISESLPILSLVDLAELAEFPAPWGETFRKLGTLGVKTLSEKPARALAQLLVGKVTGDVVSAYLSRTSAQGDFTPELSILVPLITSVPSIAVPIYEGFLKAGGPVAQRLTWFSNAPGGVWDRPELGVSHLVLASGLLPQGELTGDQYATLLVFPHPQVRAQTAQFMQGIVQSNVGRSVLSQLIRDPMGLSPTKVPRLVVALAVPDSNAEAQAAAFQAWLSEDVPPTPLVLKLLAGYPSVVANDPFVVAATQYLSSRYFSAGVEDGEIDKVEVRKIATHPDVLVRALAVSLLDPAVPEDRKVLETIRSSESNERIRAGVIERLSISEQ